MFAPGSLWKAQGVEAPAFAVSGEEVLSNGYRVAPVTAVEEGADADEVCAASLVAKTNIALIRQHHRRPLLVLNVMALLEPLAGVFVTNDRLHLISCVLGRPSRCPCAGRDSRRCT